MKKKLLLRSIMGFPIGIAIGYIITIFISLGWGGGNYSACVPELAAAMGSEIGAVVFQAALCGLLGAGCAASSVIWEVEHWSMVQQTGLYFFILSLLVLPIAYFSYWMEHTVQGFLTYFGIFVLIFAAIWLMLWGLGRRNVRKMNERLQKKAR